MRWIEVTLSNALKKIGQNWNSNPWGAALAALALACTLGLTAYRVVRTYHTPSKDDFSRHGHIDFHHGVYFPAHGFGKGYNPWSQAYLDAFPLRRPMALYSPGAQILFLPFGWMPLRAGDIVYFCVNALLTCAVAYAALRTSGIAVGTASLSALTAALVASRPGHINLALGQITLPLVLGAWAALEWGSRKPARAALGLFVTTIKPTFGIPFLWLTFCRGDRRAAIWGGLLAVAVAGWTVAIQIARTGWSQWLNDLKFASSFLESSAETIPTETWTRIDGMVLLSRLADANPTSGATALFAAMLLLGGGYLVSRMAREERSIDKERCGLATGSALGVCLIALVCVYHNFYDALLLTAPGLALTTGRIGENLSAGRRWLLLGTFLVPFVNYASTRTFLERFDLGSVVTTWMGAANSLALWLGLLILAEWGVRRRGVVRGSVVTPDSHG